MIVPLHSGVSLSGVADEYGSMRLLRMGVMSAHTTASPLVATARAMNESGADMERRSDADWFSWVEAMDLDSAWLMLAISASTLAVERLLMIKGASEICNTLLKNVIWSKWANRLRSLEACVDRAFFGENVMPGIVTVI